jgi:hypothetical protein
MALCSRILPLLAACLCVAPALAQTELYRLDGGGASEQYGTSVAVLGDLDADGADDFAVGAPYASSRAGVVRLHSGKTGAVLHTLTGLGADDLFGQDVVALGDVDGDTLCDFAVGAPEREFNPGDCWSIPSGFGTPYGDGYVVVYSGATATPLYTLSGPVGEQSGYGFALGAGGDVNGGGPDLIVCGGLAQRADVHEGSSGALIRTHSFTSSFGYCHAADIVGDVDGDTRDDYVIGWVEQIYCYSGAVELWSGLGGGQVWSDWFCSTPGDEYGFSAVGVGDLDGDALPDVFGCGLDNSGLACTSKSFVRALDGTAGTAFHTSTGSSFAGRGRAIVGLGDLDGDGDAEVALGQPGIGFVGGGADVRVESGTTGELALSIAPDADTDRFGCALEVGDVNGDGLLDLLVGARWDDDSGADAGSVRVFSVFLGPTVYCEAEVNSQGCTPAIFATGTPSAASSSLRVKASGVLNNKAGLLFFGTTPKQTPFGTAFRCITAPTVRTPLQNSGGNPPPDDCSGFFSFHFNKAFMQSKGLGAGDSIYCQYWSRDAQSSSTTNFTNGLAFTISP